jgi:hypothetical protein
MFVGLGVSVPQASRIADDQAVAAVRAEYAEL